VRARASEVEERMDTRVGWGEPGATGRMARAGDRGPGTARRVRRSGDDGLGTAGWVTR
jgi:hypothetical protein